MCASTVFPFGVPSNDTSLVTLTNLSWTVSNRACWALLAANSTLPSKTALLDALQAQARFHPPGSASHPLLATLPLIKRRDGPPQQPTVANIVQFVSFKTQLVSSGGNFEDHTARYYAIWEEDKLTTRKQLRSLIEIGAEEIDLEAEALKRRQDERIDELALALMIDELLELPLMTLSNGQTRRARILQALLKKPELLILEEPFTGLDVASRSLIVDLLTRMHSTQSPRMLLVLRPQDKLPPLVTHVAIVGSQPGKVELGTQDEILGGEKAKVLIAAGVAERDAQTQKKVERQQRGKEQVGSGKSALLAVILGDHPRSSTKEVTLFGWPRDKRATATSRSKIRHVSPKINNLFPRKWGPAGLTATEAIVTGFESVYSYCKVTPARQIEINTLLAKLDHSDLTPQTLARNFAKLTPSLQLLVLLLRALVKHPLLLMLDKCFLFMDKETIDIVKRLLDTKLRPEQAVILITHFEEEIPDSVAKTLKLDKGTVIELL